MVAIDTNVLLRVLVDDDAAQATRARRWMTRHEDEGILVDQVVLVELVWVLRARYRQEPSYACSGSCWMGRVS
jgi:predicted nucleic-acid-binding protein